MFALKGLKTFGGVALKPRAASSLVTKFDDAVNKLPLREAVRYINKNMKWTAGKLQGHINSQGNALIDLEYKAGESIGIWFPESAEKHVLLMAAAKIGLRVFELDSKVNTVAQIRKFLQTSQCRSIWFNPYDGDQNNLLLLRKAIPELYEYDDSCGQFFHSKHFPALKFFIQSGSDVELGCLPYSGFFLPEAGLAEEAAKTLSDDTPFYTQITKGDNDTDIVVSPTLTRAQVLEHPSWHFAKQVVAGQYLEVDDRVAGRPAVVSGYQSALH